MKEKSILVIFIAFVIFILKPIGNSAMIKPKSELLNKQIRKLLDENLKKTGSNLKLTDVFNEKRNELNFAEIRDFGDEEKNQDKAEAAINDFKEFARDYTKIADKLADAVKDLNDIKRDFKLPIELKYEAFKLIYKLEESATIKDAEKALQAYEDFKKKLKNYGNDTTPSQQTTPTSPSTSSPSTSASTSPPTKFSSSSPALTEENVKDLKEIINIFNKLVRKNSPEMDDLTDEVLTKPKALKKLSKALRQLSEKDCYDDNYISGLRLYFF